jgi:hypothetical protein
MGMTRDKIVGRLRRAQRDQRLVRIERRGLFGHSLDGYVLQVTDRWVVIEELEDAVYFDGFGAVRVKDITSVKWNRDAAYVERALAVIGRPARSLAIPEDAKTRDVIEAAASSAPLIGVHSEQHESEPMWIGRLEGTRKKRFGLLFINPDGTWDSEPDEYRYKDITRVEVGSRYLEALERFGDAPPPPSDVAA